MDNNDYIYCTQCGTKLKSDACFCKNCGAKVDRKVSMSTDTTFPANDIILNRKNKKGLLVVIIVLLLAVLVFSIVFFLNNKEEKKYEEKNENIVEQTIVRRMEENDSLILRKVDYYASGAVSSDEQHSYYENGALQFEEYEYPLEGFETGHIYVNYGKPKINEPQMGVVYGNSIGETEVNDTGYVRVYYDAQYRITKTEELDLKLNVLNYDSYKYDKSGNLIEKESVSEGYVFTDVYEYDEYNLMTSKTSSVKSAKNNGGKTYTYKYDFDENGRAKVRYEYLNTKLNCTTKITRDSNGLIICEETTDSDGKTIKTEYERILKSNVSINNNEEVVSAVQEVEEQEENSEVTLGKEYSEYPVDDYSKSIFNNLIFDLDEAYYDDLASDGGIVVCREKPSKDNNNASYSISGRGFSTIYDTDCIKVEKNEYYEFNYYFYSYGTYYLIEVTEEANNIYYGDSIDKCNNLCGKIGIICD